MVELDNSPSMKVSLAPAETNSVISSHKQTPPPITTAKPKRKLPGMPDPDAEVIALSPRTLLATNRFVCEVCNKGFQRDQNLQLHRRGHNLPWKLRQRISGQEIRKRVYLCPEPNCVHHDPARALGDLTGVKKHFCRKHGEKKWRCERCSKKYAVQSDWKAHMKTCGTKEYRCDCGTLFSRRDSFITHRAFCDALADESARYQASLATTSNSQAAAAFKPPIAAPKTSSSSPPPPLTSSTGVLSPVLSVQSSELPENKQTARLQQQPIATVSLSSSTTAPCSSLSTCSSNVSSSSGVFSSMVASSLAGLITKSSSSHSPSSYSELICAIADSGRTTVEPMSLSLSSSLRVSNNTSSSLVPATEQDHHSHFMQQPALSATALLQKAAQLGATSSTSSFLLGLGLSVSSSSGNQDVNGIFPINKAAAISTQWIGNVKQEEGNSIACGLGLSSDDGSNITGMIMDPSSIFGNRHTTLDFLGLGVAKSGAAPSSRLSALLRGFDVSAASFGGGVGSEGQTWESSAETRPSPL